MPQRSDRIRPRCTPGDTECEYSDNHQRVAGTAAEHTEGVADVLALLDAVLRGHGQVGAKLGLQVLKPGTTAADARVRGG